MTSADFYAAEEHGAGVARSVRRRLASVPGALILGASTLDDTLPSGVIKHGWLENGP